MFQLLARREADESHQRQAWRRSRDNHKARDPEPAPVREVAAHLTQKTAFELFKKASLQNVYNMFGGEETVMMRMTEDHQQEVGCHTQHIVLSPSEPGKTTVAHSAIVMVETHPLVSKGPLKLSFAHMDTRKENSGETRGHHCEYNTQIAV